MKASFFERVIAVLIDGILVSMLAGMVITIFMTTTNNNYAKKINDLTTKYTSSEIATEAYLEELSTLYYKKDKSEVPTTVIGILMTLLYYGYYQYANSGSTLGKKILKIKIIKRSGELTLNDLIIRSLIVNGALVSIILLIFLTISKENTYFIGLAIIEIVYAIFLFTTSMFILYRNDKRGLHDLMCNTEVISYRKEA